MIHKHELRKKIAYWMICAVLFVACAAASLHLNQVDAAKKEYSIVGTWNASTYAVGTDFYTGYLKMRVDESGEFDIFDVEAGNPGIKGVLTAIDETTLDFDCEDDEDFDSPWPGMKQRDQVEYHFYNNNQIRLTCNGRSIVFEREGKGLDPNFLFHGKWNSVLDADWYTNDGVKASVTYKLNINNGALRLYRKTKNKEILLGSFSGLTYDKKTQTLKTITELKDASKLPKAWRGMTEGRHFQKFRLSYDSKKHCLKVTHNGKTLSFYSDLIYGVRKGSIQYVLSQSTVWECKSGNIEYSVSYSNQEGTECLYMTRLAKKSFSCASAYIKALNTAKKTITVAWENAAESDDTILYDMMKSSKTIKYRVIRSNKVELVVGGKKYVFTPVR